MDFKVQDSFALGGPAFNVNEARKQIISHENSNSVTIVDFNAGHGEAELDKSKGSRGSIGHMGPNRKARNNKAVSQAAASTNKQL